MMILLLFSRHKEPSVFSKTNKQQQQQTTTNIQDTQVQFLEMQNIVAQRPFFQAQKLVLVIFRGLFIIKV